MKLSDITIVLVRTIKSGNIGSVSRAMKNAGLSQLILVNPCDFENDEARKMAVGDMSILKKAKIFRNLKTAIKPFHWTVATTRRKRRRFNQFFSPRQVAEKIGSLPAGMKVAIVFGPEDQGLENQELALCQSISCIPSHSSFPSLNLAQAVMVYAYEIYVASLNLKDRLKAKGTTKTKNHEILGFGTQNLKQAKDIASQKEFEGMFGHLKDTLEHLGYFTKGKPETLMESIRNFMHRAQLGSRDIRILRGVFTTIVRKTKN